MATAILSNVGRATDSPFGQIIGSVVGGSIDRALTGTPSTGALALQSSAYGEAIPRIYGTMRVSGGVLWSTGLTQNGTVLDKLVGGASGPSYSTNIAVGISARPIQGIGRIWADGKLMRDASGETSVAGAIRIYTGAEDQAADPLIVAVEGMAGAPAYRGIAYVVFDNLGLDDFANHVPQFGFEVFADPASVTLATVAIDLSAAAGAASPNASALTATLDGYGVGGGSTLGGALGQLAVLEPHSLVAEDRRLVLRTPLDAPAFVLNERVGGAFAGSKHAQTRVWRTEAAQRAPDLIEVRYFDPARDHQIGQQNASARRATRAIKTYDLPASMTAVAARALAARLGYDAEAARGTRSISLPYAYAAIEVGDTVVVDDDPRTWIVRRIIIDSMVVGLDLEAWAGAGAISASADAGRSLVNPFARQGPTTLDLLDLPAFDDDGGTLPRLWMAVSGDSAWRAAALLGSIDGGASFMSLGVARARAIIGATTTILAAGPCERWDEVNSVQVTLTNADDWLTSASDDAVLGGVNLAIVGGELIAFRNADATGPGQFRLSGLLRGRFGTEFASAAHGAYDRFVLIDRAKMIVSSAGYTSVGAPLLVKAVGLLETGSAVTAQAITPTGANLRPFAPVGLKVTRRVDGTLDLVWTRRSRIGSGWPDGSDTPLGETSEQYSIVLTPNIGPGRTYPSGGEALSISPAEQISQTSGLVTGGEVTVAQVSALVGPGPRAQTIF